MNTDQPWQSKKYRMAVMALASVLFVFMFSALAMIFKPVVAASIGTLAAVVVGSIMTLVSIYCASQAAVDFKTASVTGK